MKIPEYEAALLKAEATIDGLVEALTEAERLYSRNALLANGEGCGKWIARTRAVLAKYRTQGDEDPTPWCTACGAMTKEKCSCLPTDPMD